MTWLLVQALLLHAWAFQPEARPRPVPRIPPPDIQRGEQVMVTVLSGAVRLKFEAQAESTARIGESVIVRNPENGRRFIARVEEKGKVLVKK